MPSTLHVSMHVLQSTWWSAGPAVWCCSMVYKVNWVAALTATITATYLWLLYSIISSTYAFSLWAPVYGYSNTLTNYMRTGVKLAQAQLKMMKWWRPSMTAIVRCRYITSVKPVLTLHTEILAIESSWLTIVSFHKPTVVFGYLPDLIMRQLWGSYFRLVCIQE